MVDVEVDEELATLITGTTEAVFEAREEVLVDIIEAVFELDEMDVEAGAA